MDLSARPVLIGLGFIIAVCGAVVLWVERNSAAPMDFIERHLGFSPDDGNGSMEVMLLIVLVMIIAASAWRLSNRSLVLQTSNVRPRKLLAQARLRALEFGPLSNYIKDLVRPLKD
ncbi:MAG: hypothetical protein WCD13_16615 [Pseudolabrys sp.]